MLISNFILVSYGTGVRGLKIVANIKPGYIFDNREMGEMGKVLSRLSKYIPVKCTTFNEKKTKNTK